MATTRKTKEAVRNLTTIIKELTDRLISLEKRVESLETMLLTSKMAAKVAQLMATQKMLKNEEASKEEETPTNP